jgi:hypothetical protein
MANPIEKVWQILSIKLVVKGCTQHCILTDSFLPFYIYMNGLNSKLFFRNARFFLFVILRILSTSYNGGRLDSLQHLLQRAFFIKDHSVLLNNLWAFNLQEVLGW